MAGSPSVASIFAQRIVVGVGDLAASNNPRATISTYALGSCIGVIAYDREIQAGGILHLMLPDSAISAEKAARQPAMFADTGLPQFFRALTGLKAMAARVRLYVAGGASVLGGEDPFRIGERNIEATLAIIARTPCRVEKRDVGGNFNRTVHLEMATGEVTIRTPHDTSQFSLAA
jgi:chemotaxis protein CheD